MSIHDRACVHWFLARFAMVGLLCLSVAPGSAATVKKVAVFPFELAIDQQMSDGFMPPVASDSEKARLKLMDQKLGKMLEESGNFSLIDLSSRAEEIEKAAPLFNCNGCEIDFAKAAGADVLVVGFVRKSSSALISIYLKDVESGAILKAGAVSVREQNDMGWLRAVRSVVRSRILKRAQ